MISFLVCCFGLLMSTSVAVEEETDEEKAAAILEKTAASVRSGHYKSVVGRYRNLARDYPDTPAGKTAQRRLAKNTYLGATDVLRHGPSNNRVDVVSMGDGFELGQQGDFDTLAKVTARNFERYDVLDEYYPYFNFIRVNLASEESGVSGYNRAYDTTLGARRSGAIQGQVAVNRGKVFSILDELPEHDRLAIAYVKNGDLGTGGAGVASVGGRSPKTMVHEFGHAFASLMDEYSSNTGHRGQVSSGPNVSATDDEDRVPWKHWLEARVSGVGIYQGADGRPKGAWKPTHNRIMDTGVDFCAVCREAIVLRIYSLVDPIDSADPVAHTSREDMIRLDGRRTLGEVETYDFTVQTLRPKHSLVGQFWILSGQEMVTPTTPDLERREKDRRRRGPLAKIHKKPDSVDSVNKSGRFTLTVDPRDLDPGMYQIVFRVHDPTKVRGERHPWVLKDDAEVLRSERMWWVLVVR